MTNIRSENVTPTPADEPQRAAEQTFDDISSDDTRNGLSGNIERRDSAEDIEKLVKEIEIGAGAPIIAPIVAQPVTQPVNCEELLQQTEAIIKTLDLREQFITWPTEDETIQSIAAFQRQRGFPNVIGAIDGTYVVIDTPNDNPEAYINRKDIYSIQLQVVCKHNLQFIHCFVGYPGSVHDQKVFQLSNIQRFFNDPLKFPNNSHVIGDAAYKIQQHLLVPFKHNKRLTERQRNFNYCLSSTRMAVERSIGLLKGRFRILLDKLHVKRTDLIPNYIMACCVLHNLFTNCLTWEGYRIPFKTAESIVVPARSISFFFYFFKF
ncbi:PREDICTED: putative nuclease HARBI1 [Wasmannia auropunctata]|uniref:putative nuclease HARBI1 n=1 Tax=Wasmannia auropunctata TaxID=64793 RepID=UPI0005EE0CE6|nr:PREDICTED: putative nuclease HARBI1 [Wasmannia auropunctata]